MDSGTDSTDRLTALDSHTRICLFVKLLKLMKILNNQNRAAWSSAQVGVETFFFFFFFGTDKHFWRIAGGMDVDVRLFLQDVVRTGC